MGIFHKQLFLFVLKLKYCVPPMRCKFTKCEQLCFSQDKDPTPNCRSFSGTILLSWYFINLHHVCQAWHIWQWGQCGLLLFESTGNTCFTVLQMSTLNKTFDKTKQNKNTYVNQVTFVLVFIFHTRKMKLRRIKITEKKASIFRFQITIFSIPPMFLFIFCPWCWK